MRRNLIASKLAAAWPKVGCAAVCNIVDFIDPHLCDAIADPRRCLLPETEWPTETPRSKVHASGSEWYSLCKEAVARGMFEDCPDDEVSTNQLGEQVLIGAMGVDKLKELPNGIVEEQLRFISIVTPLNVYSRKLNGDSQFLPQVSFISNMILHDEVFAWVDAADLLSCFNLFVLPKQWRGFLAFPKRVSRSIFNGPRRKLALCRSALFPWAGPKR